MGRFDEVHAGSRCGQSKALGKAARALLPGDTVRLVPAPMSQEEVDCSLPGGTERPELDFALAMPAGGYLTVRGGHLVSWQDEAATDLPVFDAGGYLMTGHPAEPAEASAAAEDALACPACTAVRTGRAEQSRAHRAAFAQALRDQAAERRALRARSGFRAV